MKGPSLLDVTALRATADPGHLISDICRRPFHGRYCEQKSYLFATPLQYTRLLRSKEMALRSHDLTSGIFPATSPQVDLQVW